MRASAFEAESAKVDATSAPPKIAATPCAVTVRTSSSGPTTGPTEVGTSGAACSWSYGTLKRGSVAHVVCNGSSVWASVRIGRYPVSDAHWLCTCALVRYGVRSHVAAVRASSPESTIHSDAPPTSAPGLPPGPG